MSDTYIQNLFAERIGGSQYGKSTAIYKFEKIKRAKRAALAANPGAEIIDMGVGEPDGMAFPEVIAKLNEAALRPENRGYAGRELRPTAERAAEDENLRIDDCHHRTRGHPEQVRRRGNDRRCR